MADNHKIEWNLLENGIDFVRSSVELFFAASISYEDKPFAAVPRVAERPDHTFKYAILHLHAGCLLLLKERLRREHPALIYKDVDVLDPKKQKTVDFDQALKRLRVWSDYELTTSNAKLLRRLQNKRNALEHFKVELNRKEAQALISESVEFAYVFLRDELEVRLEDRISEEAWHHVSALREVAERIEAERRARWEALQKHYREASPAELEALADEGGSYDPSDGGVPFDALECDACGEYSLYLEPTHEALVCTNPDCRELSPIGDCERCGALVRGDGWCADCIGYMQYQMEKD